MKKQALTKNIFSVLIAFLFVLTCFFMQGCINGGADSNSDSSQNNTGNQSVFTVALIENETCFDIVSDNPVKVSQGDSAHFLLRMRGEYCAESVTHQNQKINCQIVNNEDGSTAITVDNIAYSLSLEINCSVAQARISYYPNGGEYIDGGDSSKPYTVGYSLKNQLRPNTEIGTDRIRREGYVLIGWNSLPDGSGERTGLGSRVTVENNRTISLYAQWEEETPAREFIYTEENGEITLTSYIGSREKVTVPSYIDGKPVRNIARNTFTGKILTVILPQNIERVENGAFRLCDIRELYFFDNISYISDDSFVRCFNFSTININAIQAPRYGKDNLYTELNFADKYDILALNKDKKKVIVFGGSGAYFSVDTLQMEQELNSDIQMQEQTICINMAVNGWFNSAAQLDMLSHYLRKGDVFVHVPETSSLISFLYDVSMTPEYGDFKYNKLRLYYCMEANYDLFSLINIQNVEDIFDGFTQFNDERAELPESSYTDYLTQVNIYGDIYENQLGYIDERGNFALPKKPRGNLLDIGEADIVSEYVKNEVAHNRLNAYYDAMTERGVNVCFVTAPINEETLLLRLNNPDQLPTDKDFLFSGRPFDIPLGFDNLHDWIMDFEDAVAEYLHCNVLLPLSQTVFEQDVFFDSDYHLADEAAADYTKAITSAVKEVV